MSLWSVPDQETLDLMQLFYSKWLSGTEMHEALKQAQLEMRERVRHIHGHDLPTTGEPSSLLGDDQRFSLYLRRLRLDCRFGPRSQLSYLKDSSTRVR